MSKYYKVDDVSRAIIELPNAENCYSGSYDKAEILNALEDLPTIEVSEDCISKGYLEQEIENHLLSTENLRTEKDEWWNKAFDVMVEIIEDAPSVVPSREEGEWVPCSERLPTNDDWVIVSVLDENGDTPYRYSDPGWYLEVAKCWIVESEQRTDVIAWMPLPQPYTTDIPQTDECERTEK